MISNLLVKDQRLYKWGLVPIFGLNIGSPVFFSPILLNRRRHGGNPEQQYSQREFAARSIRVNHHHADLGGVSSCAALRRPETDEDADMARRLDGADGSGTLHVPYSQHIFFIDRDNNFVVQGFAIGFDINLIISR